MNDGRFYPEKSRKRVGDEYGVGKAADQHQLRRGEAEPADRQQRASRSEGVMLPETAWR